MDYVIIPGHGKWCNSRTYPTRCKYCGERVFYFTCDHGCKVFFDDLGIPWPEHRCLGYMRAQYGDDIVAHGLAAMMMTRGEEISRRIDKDYSKAVRKEHATERPPEIVRCEPYDNCPPEEIEGVVREIIPKVNMLKRFGFEPFTLGVSALGLLARDEYAQMTVHTGTLAEEDHTSYTFFVKRESLDLVGAICGDLVTCRLVPLTILGRGTVWLCDRLDAAF